jgi:hypothetical protein
MGRAALAARDGLAAGRGDHEFLEAKVATARFYGDHILARAPALADSIVDGARGVLALPEVAF